MNNQDFNIDKFLSELEPGPSPEEYLALEKALKEKVQILKGQDKLVYNIDESSANIIFIEYGTNEHLKLFPPVFRYLANNLPKENDIIKIQLHINDQNSLAYLNLINLKGNNKKNEIFRTVFIDEPLELNMYLFNFLGTYNLLEY